MILTTSNAADRRRRFVRPAVRILAALEAGRSTRSAVTLPFASWEICCDQVRRVNDVQARGWSTAAEYVRRGLFRSLETVTYALRDALRNCSDAATDAARPTLRLVVEDLAALEGEFDEVGFDLQKRQVWVVTDAIELDQVDLGRFKIKLNWSQLDDTRPYSVKALDPNTAAGDSSVTHPHVRDGALCEGDGKAAIRAALEEGRLFDFFLLVRQILETYNSGSAYVRLENWSGVTCADCGCSSDQDDSSLCERCESDLCSDCVSSCSDCGRSSCSECRNVCHGCDADYCRRCLNDCDGCLDSFCSECLTDGKCASCREPPEEEDESPASEAAETAATPSTDAQVHPLGVGEIGLLA